LDHVVSTKDTSVSCQSVMGEEEEHSLIAVGRGAHGSCCGMGNHSAGGGSGGVPVLRWEHAIVHAQLEVATCPLMSGLMASKRLRSGS
jgi:hypothetical protein